MAIYRKYNPPKLDDVDRLMETFAGREEELLFAATRKYMMKNQGNGAKKTLTTVMMEALSPIVIDKTGDVDTALADGDEEIDDEETGECEEEGAEEEGEGTAQQEEDTAPKEGGKGEEGEKKEEAGTGTGAGAEEAKPAIKLPKPQEESAEDAAMREEARKIQEWSNLDFENMIIKWKRALQRKPMEAPDKPPLGGRGTFENFLSECFSENIAFDGKGKVRWIDDRVQGKEWRGVFGKLGHAAVEFAV